MSSSPKYLPKEKPSQTQDTDTVAGKIDKDDDIQEKSLSVIVGTWKGPLPPPDIFNQYPLKAQDSILQSMEKEQTFRHKIREQQIKGNIRQKSRNSLYIFIILIFLITIGGVLAYIGTNLSFIPFGIAIAMMIIRFWNKLRDVFSEKKYSHKKNNGRQNSEE